MHVTDLHISIPPNDIEFGQRAVWRSIQAVFPSRARAPLLQATASLVFDYRKTIDVLVLSGDLADDGDNRNLVAAANFLTAPSMNGDAFFTNQGLPTLGVLGDAKAQVMVVPGNHDRFIGVARMPGGTLFDAIFGQYWHHGLGGVQSMIIPGSDSSLGLVAADFCLHAMSSAPKGIWGQGLANAVTVDALISETQRIRQDKKPVGIIWVLHFPPFLDIEESLRLWYSEHVVNAARANGITHILAGHLHRNQSVSYDTVEIICTGSATSDLYEIYGNWIAMFDVDVNRAGRLSVSQKLFRYDAAEAAFVES